MLELQALQNNTCNSGILNQAEQSTTQHYFHFNNTNNKKITIFLPPGARRAPSLSPLRSYSIHLPHTNITK